MSTTIICTPGGATDNSYVTTAAATAYFAGLRAATWTAFDATLQEAALIDATKAIENMGGERRSVVSPARSLFPGTPYHGTTTTGAQGQALHFPRTTDCATIGGVLTLFVPPDIVAAVCEQALWLLQKQAAPDLVDHDENQRRNIKSFAVDGYQVSYGDKPDAAKVKLCSLAADKIAPYVQNSFGIA